MEAKVNWHYTCPICGEMFEYAFAAGPAIKKCSKCKKPKKCLNCRKYEREDCPPWPVKGPDHWCTQYKERVK